MTDHHDFGDHHFDDDPLPFEEHSYPEPDHLAAWDDSHHDLADLPAHEVDEPAAVTHPDVVEAPEVDLPAETHPDIPDIPEAAADVFPPSVDVGDLPEPVDGFPWIDSGSLGLADIAAAVHQADNAEPVPPQELAEYAATDLPPGVDPWAALADSEDPATSALARWWSEN